MYSTVPDFGSLNGSVLSDTATASAQLSLLDPSGHEEQLLELLAEDQELKSLCEKVSQWGRRRCDGKTLHCLSLESI